MSTDQGPSISDLRKSPDGFDWSLISYFDILGLSDALRSTSPDEIRRVIGFTRHFAQASGAGIPGELEKYGVKTYRFQDSYVRACEIGWIDDAVSPDDLDQLTFSRSGHAVCAELITLCHIVINFLRNKVYVRGAVTIGEIDFAEDYALGPGLVTAHELESRQAKYPRIIVEERALKGFMHHPWSRAFAPSVVSIDHDGKPFIDYLKEACRECMASPYAFLELLREHATWVRRFVEKAEGNPALKSKSDWLLDYHNDTAALFPGLERKTGFSYSDLALPEPDTDCAEYRQQRLRGVWPSEDALWDRSWGLEDYLRKNLPEMADGSEL